MRYLKATLLLGLLTSLIIAGLYEAGVFHHSDDALRNLLRQPLLPPERSLAQYAVFIALAFALVWTAVDIPRASLKLVVAFAALGEVFAVTGVLNQYHLYFSPFAPAAAVILGTLFGLLYSRSAAGQRKRVLRAIFGDRISRQTFHALVNGNTPLEFTGETREASVVVCEVFNHEELLEGRPPAEYVALINRFLRSTSDFLVEKGGYLDECDGESLRVVFGEPLPDENHAATACAAALELARLLDVLNAEIAAQGQPTLDFRLGVNSGEVVTALYGSQRLGTFSVAGETVEFARRLCAANCEYGSRIMVGPGTLDAAGERIVVRPLDLLRGHEEWQREEIYELLGQREGMSEEELKMRDLFWKGIVYFREEKWAAADEHFRAAQPPDRVDLPVEYYLRRTEAQRGGKPLEELENSPVAS